MIITAPQRVGHVTASSPLVLPLRFKCLPLVVVAAAGSVPRWEIGPVVPAEKNSFHHVPASLLIPSLRPMGNSPGAACAASRRLAAWVYSLVPYLAATILPSRVPVGSRQRFTGNFQRKLRLWWVFGAAPMGKNCVNR